MSSAGELHLTSPNVCPACGQKLKAPKRRVCGTCGQPILKRHRYFFDGSVVRHCDCAKPTERRKVTA